HYRSSFKRHNFYAGLLGHDVLLLHDEAHLTAPFQALLERVVELQATHTHPNNLRVLPLSATQDIAGGDIFRLDDEDLAHPVVASRVGAKKTLRLHETDKLEQTIAEKALSWADEPVKVLVYVRSPEHAGKIRTRIAKALKDEDRVALLTGRIRGKERDDLAKSSIVRRLTGNGADLPRLDAAVYLVATSAGEVGADFDGDHLVGDVCPADALVQRLGRVNRRGDRNDVGGSEVHLFAPPKPHGPAKVVDAIHATNALLTDRGAKEDAGINAGPMAVRDWVNETTRVELPPLQHLSVEQFDALTMTSVQGDWSLRPELAPLIHGSPDYEPPQTTLLWRSEVAAIADDHIDAAATVLTAHRPRAHERLAAPSKEIATFLRARVSQILKTEPSTDPRTFRVLRRQFGGETDWLWLDNDRLDAARLEAEIAEATLVLPADFGGLDNAGMLDAKTDRAELDVADMDVATQPQRDRVLLTHDEITGKWTGQRLGEPKTANGDTRSAVLTHLRETLRVALDTIVSIDPQMETRLVLLRPAWRGGGSSVTLNRHTDDVERQARRIGRAVGGELEETLAFVARWHDHGKRRAIFQAMLGNTGDEPWAKGDNTRGSNGRLLHGYRHEHGSAWDLAIALVAGNAAWPDGVDPDLALHLITAHHGRSRPCFDPAALIDPEHAGDPPELLRPAAVAKRFHALQRKHGAHRLAWMEALVQSADTLASKEEAEHA
ncbi:MAG: type I-U CRISPR-associated helicase/endonuclease Cas3, partial [Planctomycetota bacterium]